MNQNTSMMFSLSSTEIQIRGRTVAVPSSQIDGKTIIVTGKWLKIASIFDEDWIDRDGDQSPESLFAKVKEAPLKADIFTFSQNFDEGDPKYGYHFEWDNAAAAPALSFKEWWEEKIPQESRKNVRRAKRMGVEIKEVEFNDALVQGIMGIYNADPVRQTGKFWHYGKSFDVVKKENATYLDRSCILGAYFGEELVGFIKMVYVKNAARLMQIVAKSQHRDKRPMNALVARAIEICEQKKVPYLLYGRYTYGNKTDSPLTEFKRRNGFEKKDFPKYFVPLTVKGRIAIALRLHRGILGILPPALIAFLVEARRRILQRTLVPPISHPPSVPLQEKAVASYGD